MRILSEIIFAAVAAGAVQPLHATDGELLVQSDDSAPFAVYSVDDAVYATSSLSEIASLPPVFSRPGETVTATSPSGVAAILGSASLASVLNAGGVWTLANSVHGFARIGVAWAVYGDGGTLATGGAAEAYAADSMQSGPNRRIHFHDVLPVAYTGDNWVGDASKAATVTFTPPAGSGLDPTTLNLTGTGTQSFAFQKPGLWTVRLTMSNGMVREATVNISTGMMLIVI